MAVNPNRMHMMLFSQTVSLVASLISFACLLVTAGAIYLNIVITKIANGVAGFLRPEQLVPSAREGGTRLSEEGVSPSHGGSLRVSPPENLSFLDA